MTDWCKALELLVNPESEWIDGLDSLNRLDYVVRDLHLTGRIGVTLDVDRLVANINQQNDPDWLLIRKLADYLRNTLYEEYDRQTDAAIFRRTMASLLIEGKINIEELFGIDPENYLDDDDIVRIFNTRKQGQELFDPQKREAWKTWQIRCAVEADRPPILLEKQLSGSRSAIAFLALPSKKRILLNQLTQPDHIALATRHRDASDRPLPADLLLTAKRILEVMHPAVHVPDVHKALLEALCGCEASDSLQTIPERLGGIRPSDGLAEKKVVKYVADHLGKLSSDDDIKVVVAGVDQPLSKQGIILPFKFIEAAISGSESQRRKLGMSLENARRSLWSYLLQWQNRFFQRAPVKSLADLCDSIQSVLQEKIINNEDTKGSDLELYLLFEALLHPKDNVKFRLVLPNLILKRPDGNKENEYDIVSMVLKSNNQVEFWIWGATTDQNPSRKRKDDIDKIQKLKDKIGQYWSGEIRTPHCYAYVENSAIKLEFDGRQEIRQL